MKRLNPLIIFISLYSCLIMLMSPTQAAGENYNPYAPSYTTYDVTYDAIIHMYLKVFEIHRNGGDAGRHDLYNDNIDWDYSAYFETDKDAVAKNIDYIKNHVGYAIRDINGDGIDELLIGSGQSYIYEVFTMDEGKVRELIRAGARYGCNLLNDGTLLRLGSSGAAFWGYYAFQMNGTKPVVFVKGYHYNGEIGENNGLDEKECWFKAESDKGLYSVTMESHVSASEVDDWIKQCDTKLANIQFIPFAAYEQGINGQAIGVLSYKGET